MATTTKATSGILITKEKTSTNDNAMIVLLLKVTPVMMVA